MVDYSTLTYDQAKLLPLDEYDKWLEHDFGPQMPQPNKWPLGCNEGRIGFLESYISRGEPALFQSVNHMWNSLLEPKNLLCIYIGYDAGTGGSGKSALAKFLRRALRETLDYEEPQPRWEDHWTMDEFHEATMAFFARDYAHYQRTIQKYADIMNGEPGRHQRHCARLIVGPWPSPPEPQVLEDERQHCRSSRWPAITDYPEIVL